MTTSPHSSTDVAAENTAALRVAALGVVTTATVPREILHDVNFSLTPGSSVGLVGRSGSGKSSIGNALLGLLPRGLALTPASQITLGADNLRALDQESMRAVRGRRLAMVFQEPLLALDPAMRVGHQLGHALTAHCAADGGARGGAHGGALGGAHGGAHGGAQADAHESDATERAIDMLARVGIRDARAAAQRYPHELSGGMRQRTLLAMALLLRPEVLIADEPTTALDPVLQRQLLDLLDALRRESGTALLLISHDLDLVAERCERVLVLDSGRIVEEGTSAEVVASRRRTAAPTRPMHPAADPLLVAEGVAVHFATAEGLVRAVDGVSLTLRRGECLGLVGESGSGKSTLARALLGLTALTAGRVRFGDTDVGMRDRAAWRNLRRQMQLVPQDAGASLTPHCTVHELLSEVLEVHGLARGEATASRAAARVAELLIDVGLDPGLGSRRPGALSSGERQRVAIARALACDPALLICDEPVANVDADAREQLLTLLDRLRDERNLALVFISHDHGAVRRLAARVTTLYLGKIVEAAPDLATPPRTIPSP